MSDMGHHGGHHGHLHAGHGGDGMGASQAMGSHGQHGHHGFLSHLLGLDHDSHGHHGHAQHQGVPIDKTPQGSISWASPLQAIKLSDVFQGINVTPNTMFLVLFGGMAAWLGVIYWIRHHEPLANQVLGTGGGYSTTAAADRQLVAGIRNAVPIRTGAQTGAVYVPNSGPVAPTATSGAYAASPPAPAAYPPAGYEAPVLAQPGMQGMPQAAEPSGQTFAAPAGQTFSAPTAGMPMSSYMVSVHTSEGLRVKTITNR